MKVGYSTGGTLRSRVNTVNQEQTTNAEYVLLAGLRGDRKDEAALHRVFKDLRRGDKGRRKEYFVPEPQLSEYINWLRQWWWAAIDPDTPITDLESVAPELWMPATGRMLSTPPEDPGLIVQPFQDLSGPLAGTAWDWMLSPSASVQDYFTPVELIEAARRAMGDIDLDAASHPLANRELRIKDFFHINRSAFEHDWYGRVWLNPPYGNNAPWFDRIIHFLDRREIDQICMLSPVWSFQAQQALPFMARSSATILLSPTPRFWGNADHRTGTNHPHAIVYAGDRADQFLEEFRPHGIPMRLCANGVEAAERITA